MLGSASLVSQGDCSWYDRAVKDRRLGDQRQEMPAVVTLLVSLEFERGAGGIRSVLSSGATWRYCRERGPVAWTIDRRAGTRYGRGEYWLKKAL